MVKIDLYSSYVGELEIIFFERDISNQVEFEVHLWYADFSSLMSYIPINPEAHPDSILYNWQKGAGFFDEENWECKRIQEFYEQLTAIDAIPPSAGLDDVVDALLQLCRSTLTNKNKLFITYT